jgi:hypothetical protein
MQKVETGHEVLSWFGLPTAPTMRSSVLLGQMLESSVVRWFVAAVIAMVFIGVAAKTMTGTSLAAVQSTPVAVETERSAYLPSQVVSEQFRSSYLSRR